MTISSAAWRRPTLAIAALAAGATVLPGVGLASPAQAKPWCDEAYDGGPGADEFEGTAKVDKMCGWGGADDLIGRGDDDRLYGGSGWDFIVGVGGDDHIHGGDGPDRAEGSDGKDRIYGGGGEDVIGGGPGADYIRPGPGGSSVWGDDGKDTIDAVNGDADLIDCGFGVDDIYVDVHDVYADDCEYVTVT